MKSKIVKSFVLSSLVLGLSTPVLSITNIPFLKTESVSAASVPSTWKKGIVYYSSKEGCTIVERYPVRKHPNGKYYKYIWQNKIYNYGYSSYKGIVVERLVGPY